MKSARIKRPADYNVNRKVSSKVEPGRLPIMSIVICMALTMMTLPSVHAEKPLRLLILPVERDIHTNASCVRGQLFLVRSFDEADLNRRTWIADTLEIRAKTWYSASKVLADGQYLGSARETGPEGRWRIELIPGNARLQAHPGRRTDEPAIFLGRRAGKVDGACDAESERLEDGEVVTRRLKRLIDWSSGGRDIELMVRPHQQQP